MTRAKSKYEKDYLEADKYVIVNNNDPELRPIILSLPKPPPLHLIDGYGLPVEEQRFKRMTIPRKLADIEAEAVIKVKQELASNKNNVVTLLKIQRKFWSLINSRGKELKKEIAFIRRVWWKRINGTWFFNRGKPTFISGWHFYYLNFYVMSTDDGENRPSFRDRDRIEYIFAKYCYETTETFEKLDSEGFAVPEDDGTYNMIDLGRRVCFGKMQPKNRRSGNTNKGLSNGLEVVTRTYKTDGMGCQSYSNKNAKSHFDDKLMPAFEGLPIWLKPNTTSGRTSDELVFNVGKNDYSEPSLQTKATYATTASEKFYDGLKMVYLLTDEAGKTDAEVNVAARHDVNKNTVALGNGRVIFGYMDYPSTVSEVADGAHAYRALSNTSNFYNRIKSTGQTKSGLFRLFIPSIHGLEGFIDSYGYSVAKDVNDYQLEEGHKQTAEDFLQGKFDALINSGDIDSMRLYREEKKLFPMRYDDCWLGEAGAIGFNMEKIDTRISELRRDDITVSGNLHWVNGEFLGDVEFRADEENGRWKIARFPHPNGTNKKIQTMGYSSIVGKDIPMWRPMFADRYVIGVDPFRFNSKKDARANTAHGKKSRLSDGGIAVFLKYDESIDGGKEIRDWDTHVFVASYKYGALSSDEFSEEALKCAVFYGSPVFPETNVPETLKYFIDKECEGYLLYDIDIKSGKYKEKAGIDSLERSKQSLFAKLRDYIEYRCHVEPFSEFLRECKDIRGMEEMRSFDRLTAHGVALMGCETPYAKEVLGEVDDEFDAGNFWDFNR